jgi:phage/plasmid-associated DNA primase
VAGELSENKRIAGDKFKMIIEGNEIQGQYKGKDSFIFSPTCIHWFASNHIPRTADTSNGFNRRWIVFSFTHQIDPAKRVLDLGNIIVAEEREAIVAWAAGAIVELKDKTEFTLPQSHKDKIDEIASFNNTVRYFLRASGRVKTGPDALAIAGGRTMKPITATLLHDAYQNFCLGTIGVNPVGSRTFNPMMQELTQEFGFQINTQRGGGMGDVSYSNIILVDEKKR